ncbi:MAG: choice-of-anchor Q domain-containing protein, partial [Candidatus Pacebacteria bacterium]|nr:choice-of-anchor Q domain-containing protein [Candidatus Paceibacterota bacterium]
VEYNNVSSATQSNINLYNNTVYNCNWGVQAIGGGSNTLSNNVNIYSNDITIGANWLTTSGVYHSNGSYCFYVSGASVSNLNFYDNYVHGPSNPPGSWTASGFFWVSVDPGGLASGIAVYNNLMVGVSGNPANEYVGAAGTDAIVANNTIIGYQNGAWGISVGCPSGTCATVENNIVADTSIGLSFYGTNYKAVFHSNNNDLYNNSTLAIDYRIPEDLTYTDTTARDAYWSTNYPILVNDKTLILVGTQEKLWQGSTNPNSYNSAQWTNWQDTPVYYTALSSWQADQGGCPNSYNDCASVAGNPNLSASHVPNLDSLLIGAGANLTSLGITALNSDATGAARPATGAWDIGAYQYQTGSDTIAPNSPTGLSVE